MRKYVRPVAVGVLASMPWLIAAQPGPPSGVRQALDAYVASHQRPIISELVDLLSIPNVGADVENIERNATPPSRHARSPRVSRRGPPDPRQPLRLWRPAGRGCHPHRPAVRPLRWPAGGRGPVEAAQSVRPDPPRRTARGRRPGHPEAREPDPLRTAVAPVRPVGRRRQGPARRAVRGPGRVEGQRDRADRQRARAHRRRARVRLTQPGRSASRHTAPSSTPIC